jgi:membrane protease YdiL (CAAX protease family)
MLLRLILSSRVLILFIVVAIIYGINHFFFGPNARELLMRSNDPFKKIDDFFNTVFFWFVISGFVFAFLMEQSSSFRSFSRSRSYFIYEPLFK